MDRIVNTVSARLDRSQQYEGRARRLASDSAASSEFRTLVNDSTSTTTLTSPSRSSPSPSASNASTVTTDPPEVSGWAGLVTAGKTGGDTAATTTTANTTVEDPPAPTAEAMFGESPWVTSPAGTGPLGVYYYNPVYFATAATAEKVAQIMGGKVIQQNVFCGSTGSPFTQLQANNMVELPNGRVINPGLVASFYTRGYSQSFVDRLLNIEANS